MVGSMSMVPAVSPSRARAQNSSTRGSFGAPQDRPGVGSPDAPNSPVLVPDQRVARHCAMGGSLDQRGRALRRSGQAVHAADWRARRRATVTSA